MFLRLARRLGPPQAAATLALLGAVALGWVTDDPAAFGRGLAGWTRLLRSPPLLATLLPERDTLARLLAA